MFDIIVNLAYTASFILVPYVIAFDIQPLIYVRKVEITLDIILLLGIILNFLTPTKYDKEDPSVIDVALKYIIYPFPIDIMSVIPGLISREQIPKYYYFKVLRVLHFGWVFGAFDFIFYNMKQYFLQSQETF